MLKRNRFIYLTVVIILILGIFSTNNTFSADDKYGSENIINRLNTIEGKVEASQKNITRLDAIEDKVKENKKTVIDLISSRENELKLYRDLLKELKRENTEVRTQIVELANQIKLIGENLKKYLQSQTSSTLWIAGMGIMGAILGAIIGGLITGKYSLYSIEKSHENELKRNELNEKEKVRGFLQALHTEIGSLWRMYEKAVGGFERVDSLVLGEPIFVTMPLYQSYFNIYEGNPSVIGQIKDKTLRDSIVRCYVQAKGLVDTLKMNNSLIKNYKSCCELCGQFNNDYNHKLVDHSLEELSNYSEMVIRYHNETKEEVENLMPLLLERIESGEF